MRPILGICDRGNRVRWLLRPGAYPRGESHDRFGLGHRRRRSRRRAAPISRPPRLHRTSGEHARVAPRPSCQSAARRRRPQSLVRPDSGSQRRQHLRRLSFTDERLRGHAADRDWRRQQSHRRTGPERTAQSAANADGDQQRVLPGADVELALSRAVGRSVRQQRRLRLSCSGRHQPVVPARISSRRRRSFRRPSAWKRPDSTFPGTTTTSAPK